MERKVFVSYRHTEADWVRHRLIPALKTGGCTVLVDDDWFRAGERVRDEIERWQNEASVSVLVLTPDYYESSWCRQEMARALERRNAVPLIRKKCPAPQNDEILALDLCEPEKESEWGKLLRNVGAPSWLAAVEDIAGYLERGQSVSFVARGRYLWRPIIDSVGQRLARPLPIIDLEDPETATRDGLLEAMIRELQLGAGLSDRGRDLQAFGKAIKRIEGFKRLALCHFDMAACRTDYDVNLFAGLRHATMGLHKLALLVHSHAEFRGLFAVGHPCSEIDVKTVDFRGSNT